MHFFLLFFFIYIIDLQCSSTCVFFLKSMLNFNVYLFQPMALLIFLKVFIYFSKTRSKLVYQGKNNWSVTVYHDSWIKGVTAGGCGNSPYRGMHIAFTYTPVKSRWQIAFAMLLKLICFTAGVNAVWHCKTSPNISLLCSIYFLIFFLELILGVLKIISRITDEAKLAETS